MQLDSLIQRFYGETKNSQENTEKVNPQRATRTPDIKIFLKPL